MSRLDLPVQPVARTKTTEKEAESTPVPDWIKKRNLLIKEIIENERSNVSNKVK